MFASTIAAGVLSLIVVAYWRDISGENTDRGMTSETAAVLTFALGALASVGALLAAGLLAVALVTLLNQKDPLHGFLHRIDKYEVAAAVKLLLVSVVLLPVLPNEGFGPGLVLNPYQLWWAVVLIGTIGLAGHAAIRIAGPGRGAILMGLLGGMVSSTAVTVSAARASKGASAQAARALAAATATAQGVMFARTGLLIFVMNVELLRLLSLPLFLGAFSSCAGAYILSRTREQTDLKGAVAVVSPDALSAGIQFMAFAAAALLLSYYAREWAGDVGVLLSSVVAGAFDVDAATVSACQLAAAADGGAMLNTATVSVALACFMNSIVKSAIAFSMGEVTFARLSAAVLVSSVVVMLIGLALGLWLQA